MKAWLTEYKIPILLACVGVALILYGIVASRPVAKPTPIAQLSSTSSNSRPLFVHVAGAVQHPGVYQLADSSRVTDALSMAGGLSGSADKNWVDRFLNLAEPLTDGKKIYIPKVGEEVQSSVLSLQTGISAKVNINTASSSLLEELPGVGPKTAEKIIGGRPYKTPYELVEKKIIYASVYEKIKDEITTY
ncbi:MAG TPA: ComEA family DNA-binding protein [Patescibacteria group bacterium]|nr:ComEA family DNA-binding protein [Patescibacteria group bacterium]